MLYGEVIVKESTVPLLHVVYSAGKVSFQCDAGRWIKQSMLCLSLYSGRLSLRNGGGGGYFKLC